MEQVSIKVIIEQCDERPHAKVKKVYTADPFENCRAVYCKWKCDYVYNYLDWNENSNVPADCPARI